MGFDFTHQIDIERDAAEVFAYVADFENNPRWQGGMQSCQWTSPTKMEPGSTYVQQAKFFGRQIDTHFEVTDVEPDRSISIASTVSTFPIQVTRSVEDLGDGRCRVTAHVRGQPTGVLRLFSGMVRKSIRKDYDKLKKLLESS